MSGMFHRYHCILCGVDSPTAHVHEPSGVLRSAADVKIADIAPDQCFTGGHLASTAGQCSRCGRSYTMQMVTVHVNTPGENEALCADCMSKDAEKRRADWFAAEERTGR